MQFPEFLRAALEALTARQSAAHLTEEAQALSARYRGARKNGLPDGASFATGENFSQRKKTNRNASTIESTATGFVTGTRSAVAYAAARMPATYGAVSAALAQACRHVNAGSLHTLLDLGAGTGAATFAAEALLPLTSAVCFEQSSDMTAIGKELMQSGGTVLSGARWVAGDIRTDDLTEAVSGLEGGQADAVIASYMLNELPAVGRSAAIVRAWRRTRHLLLILEPGTPTGFAILAAARAQLLALGGHIAAPCPGDCVCPVAAEKSVSESGQADWCHFAVRIARSRLQKQLKGGEAPYEDEKFCYLAVSRDPCTTTTARVRRHPQILPGRVTLEFCTAKGIRAATYTHSSPLFKQSRKSDCGDEWNGENEGNASL